MDKEELKEYLPIIQALCNGKSVQRIIANDGKGNGIWATVDYIDFNYEPYNYRIKTEPKYYPFGCVEECWEEMQKHTPFGWVKKKDEDSYRLITAVFEADFPSANIESQGGAILNVLFHEYTFADGSIFGKKDENTVE